MQIKPEKFGKVAVLMGGTSSEREVSFMSGKNVLAALERKGINACGIDVKENIIDQLQQVKPNRVFIALHGTDGEDGIIQGVLDTMHIPYPSSGVAASALTMNKRYCNLFLQAAGFPVMPFVILAHVNDTAAITKSGFKFPLCVKPVSSGSSCGVSKIMSKEQLPAAYMAAREFDTEVMLQPWIEGREFTVSIFDDKALPVIEITTPNEEFYDYDAKYFKETTGYICPCDLPKAKQQELQEIALETFVATNCKHWGRVDFIQDNQGRIWLLEINTIPGITSHSLFPQAAKQVGIEFDELMWQILAFTL